MGAYYLFFFRRFWVKESPVIQKTFSPRKGIPLSYLASNTDPRRAPSISLYDRSKFTRPLMSLRATPGSLPCSWFIDSDSPCTSPTPHSTPTQHHGLLLDGDGNEK